VGTRARSMCVAVCCSVLQCVALCCSVLQGVAMSDSKRARSTCVSIHVSDTNNIQHRTNAITHTHPHTRIYTRTRTRTCTHTCTHIDRHLHAYTHAHSRANTHTHTHTLLDTHLDVIQHTLRPTSECGITHLRALLIHVYGMTHSCVWHDSFMCVA